MKSTSVHKRLRQTQARRRHRVRARISGTPERPRLTVFRSLLHLAAQIIDDRDGKTLVAASDREAKATGTGVDRAARVGMLLAKKAMEKNIDTVVFDRRGYKYHGQVKAFADAARKSGLHF